MPVVKDGVISIAGKESRVAVGKRVGQAMAVGNRDVAIILAVPDQRRDADVYR
jgi:hypothetical protein